MANRKIKEPLTSGVAKVPVVMQLEALECGAASLAMVLAYYDKWIPLEQVRSDCGVSRDGSSAINVLKAARMYGLKASGFRFEPDILKKEGVFPCIIHWNFNHFVVLDGFKGDKVYLNDPARGTVTVSMDEFDDAFTGVCLMFAPGEDFEPSGEQKSILGFVKKRLRGLRTPILFTVLTTLVISFIGVITPIFDRIFYDRLLTGQNPEWTTMFFCALGVLFLIQVIVNLMSALINLKISGKVTIVGNLSYMWKVLHLPMHFFSQRMTGDIVSRQSANSTVANTLVNTLAPLALNVIMMIFYLVVMIRYSLLLTCVGVLSVVINLLVSRYISKKRINITRVQTRDEGKLYSSTVSGVQMIETIKSSGAEEGFFEKWSGYFAAVNASEQKFAEQNQTLGLIPEIVSSLANALTLGTGIYLTLQGQFTLGMISAFLGFFASFTAPATELITAGQTIQEMRTQMERIEDVMEYPEDPNTTQTEVKTEDFRKLSGNIEIKNLTFGYAPLSPPLIEDFSMSIKPGSKVAFVGPSGCGKSTLSKLISGLYQPRSGEILFDGKRISEIDHAVFTGSVAVVDQDIIMFEDTIGNNIKMWDNSIQDFEMIMAALDARIHYDINSRPEGYRYKLTEGGKDFSGGQRQRLEIARALAQDPTIIILDEATSALDAQTEFEVTQAIYNRGLTCIVIAHRLSTIRDCDEIVVLDHGKVMERGTHSELMAKDGYYTSLITNE